MLHCSVETLTDVLLKEQQLVAEKLFKNIELGEMLGRGSYGSVYKGNKQSCAGSRLVSGPVRFLHRL